MTLRQKDISVIQSRDFRGHSETPTPTTKYLFSMAHSIMTEYSNFLTHYSLTLLLLTEDMTKIQRSE